MGSRKWQSASGSPKDNGYSSRSSRQNCCAETIVNSANGDDTRQVQDVQALISNGVQVLVIIPHNGAAMAQAVQYAHEAGIPVLGYGWMPNVGYATEEHRAAILSLGPTRHHRMTFAPLQLSLAFDISLADQVPPTP